MKKLFIIISIVSVFLLVFSATTVMANEKGLVYYLCPNQFDEMQTAAASMVKSSLEDAGYTCKVMTSGNEDVNLQMNQIENAITQNPKAIVIAAVDGTAVCAGVSSAHDAGIAVIAYDRTISKCVVDFTSIAGCKTMGLMAAQATVKLLKEKYGEVKGTVLDIMGDPGDSYTTMIEEGFQEAMKEYPNVEIETKVAYGWEAVTAGNIADDYLLVHPDTDLVLAHADHLAAAVASVLQTKGYEKGDVLLIGTAGMPMGLQLIREGWMHADIEYSPKALAEGITMFLDDILANKPLKYGPYEVMGIAAELSEKSYGPELKVAGSIIDLENVDNPQFWGNQVK